MTHAEFWALVIDVVQTAIALVVAIGGFMGFHTWKAELRGTDQYETSKKILIALVRVREALEKAHTWGGWMGDPEFMNLLTPEGQYSKERLRQIEFRGARLKMDPIQQALRDLEAESKLGRFVLGESLDAYISAIRTPVSKTYFPALRKFALEIAELESFQQFPELPHEIQEKPNAALKAFEDKILSYSR